MLQYNDRLPEQRQQTTYLVMQNMMPYRSSLLLAVAIMSLGSLPVMAEVNWPEFRGPTADGRSTETGLPVTWRETENVKWKLPIDGKAWSSPVVWGDHVWLTNATEDGHQLSAMCVNAADGKVLRDLLVFDIAEPQYCHPMNSYATPTPVVEEGRLYVHFGVHGTACIDTTTGKTLWARQDFLCDHHRGPASSPIVVDNLVMLTFDGYDVQYVVALDKKTGDTVWKKDRNIDYGSDDGDVKKAYCTPTLIEHNGRRQLVSPSAGATIAYDPASGDELWRVNHGGMNASARPLYGHGLIYINTAAGGFRLFAMRPEGEGDITDSAVQWKASANVPTRSSQLLVDDLLFMAGDTSVALCINAKTGKTVWQKRLEGNYSASPLYANGRIYFFSEEGHTPVIEASKEFKLLASNKLDDGFMASPAVSGNALILRTKAALYRIEKSN
jgi:outer membrane protein assembly factor BamB